MSDIITGLVVVVLALGITILIPIAFTIYAAAWDDIKHLWKRKFK